MIDRVIYAAKLLSLTTMFLFLPETSFAYNWSKCKNGLYEGKFPPGGYYGFGIFTISTSAANWSSSTGTCSMLGDSSKEKMMFIASNHDRLIIDSAKGSGEYLKAYLDLSKCDGSKINFVENVIRKNFQNIFGEELQNSEEETYNNFEKILNNRDLMLICNKVT